MPDLAQNLSERGFAVFDRDLRVARWATRAYEQAKTVTSDPALRAAWLRHGQTWFVGVDVLPNDATGAIDAVALAGPWLDLVTPPVHWHSAQVSVIYRGFPQQDPDETDGAHRYRIKRAGAHVDGLHLEQGRRIVRECHDFILGLPLNDARGCRLVVWEGSHTIMRAALRAAAGKGDPRGADVTEAYKTAREAVFEHCTPVAVMADPGQSILLDRQVLHGISPDMGEPELPDEGRMVAYFRPECANPQDWLLG